MSKRLGLDCYRIKIPLLLFLKRCKNDRLCVYDVKEVDEMCIFYGHIYDRKRIKDIFSNVEYMYTSGILGMLFRNFTNKYRFISYTICICLFFILQSTLFSVHIYGENDVLEKNMQSLMNTYMYKNIDIKQIKQNLLNTFKDKIHWLEVYRVGNTIDIYYKEKIVENNIYSSSGPLIAKKDGMIAYFECDKGNKLKHVNDIVYKGEVLVDNKMSTSNNEIVKLDVSGRVFAYTWQKVVVEMQDTKESDALQYFSLLLQARDDISVSIGLGEKIVKENVLHFDKNEGTIRLVILYTLLEDITS